MAELMAKERFVDVRGMRMRWSLGSGSSRPLILLNGIGGNIEMLAPLRRALEPLSTFAVDMPGSGESSVPLWPMGISSLAKLVVDGLSALGVEDFDLLGYSFGGAVAQSVARRYPDRLRRLILSSSTVGWGGFFSSPLAMAELATPARYYLAQHSANHLSFGDPPEVSFEHLRRARGARPPSPIGYSFQLCAMASWSSLPWIGQISHRTLVLQGGRDTAVLPANAQLLASKMPHARLEIIENAGHLFLMADDASYPASRIASFLEEAPSDQERDYAKCSA